MSMMNGMKGIKMYVTAIMRDPPSNAMEMEGVETIWKRSVADLKLRFNTYIGDGDC